VSTVLKSSVFNKVWHQTTIDSDAIYGMKRFYAAPVMDILWVRGWILGALP